MARKLKKGYFVRGQFIAEGSELDLEYKRELKGTDEPTRTDLKKESTELQKLGQDLLNLAADPMARRITNFEGKRRQMQFIGKLMRQLTPEQHEAIRAALYAQHMPSREETALLHHAEKWRDQLIANDDAVGQWLNLHPATDSQQLRSLARQARKDAKPEKPGEAPRHGRAYREIFQLVREALEGKDTSAAEEDAE
jgi:ribosome-associated protein